MGSKRFFMYMALLVFAAAVVACTSEQDDKTAGAVKKTVTFVQTDLPIHKDGKQVMCSKGTDSECAAAMPAGEDKNIKGGVCDKFGADPSKWGCVLALKHHGAGGGCTTATDLSGKTTTTCTLEKCTTNAGCDDGNVETANECVYYTASDGVCFYPPKQCTVGKGECARAGYESGGKCIGVAGDPAAEELCDGKDNDCNGTTDTDVFTDLGKTCTSSGIGGCKGSGKFVCALDGKTATCNAVDNKPATEQCNGKDDDCNGLTDESFTEKGKDCTVGTGICTASAKQVCKSDGSGVECGVSPGAADKQESCDNKDNTCDSKTDEGCDDDADTFCDAALTTIGKPNACPGGGGDCNDSDKAINPNAKELCDLAGKTDENCDGKVNEGYSVGTDCEAGKGECKVTGGKTVCNSAGDNVMCNAVAKNPLAEKCDGLDNDCDGVIDNGCDDDKDGFCDAKMTMVGTPAICQKSTTKDKPDDCDDQIAQIFPGQSETCNGSDDGCNGQVDEALAVTETCGKGVCATSVVTCQSGKEFKCTPKAADPAGETCNKLDDDCDGATDEDLNCSAANTQVIVAFGSSDKSKTITLDTATDPKAVSTTEKWQCSEAPGGNKPAFELKGKELAFKATGLKDGAKVRVTVTADSDSATVQNGFMLLKLEPANAACVTAALGNGKGVAVLEGSSSNIYVVDTLGLVFKGTAKVELLE